MEIDENKLIIVDGVKWWVKRGKDPTPICPKHDIRLSPIKRYDRPYSGARVYRGVDASIELKCEKGGEEYDLPRRFGDEKTYVLDRISSLTFKKMKVVNLDDEAVPVAEDQFKEDSPFWVKAKVTESKAGTRLIIWAGDRSKKNKTQLFIEPKVKRLGFDQNDDHPAEVFTVVDAKFADGVRHKIEKKSEQ